jgi:hypothetical protein
MKFLTPLILFVLTSTASANPVLDLGTAQQEPRITIEFLAQTFAVANTASVYCIEKFDKDVPVLLRAKSTLRRSQEIRNIFNRTSRFEIPPNIKMKVDHDVKQWSKGYLEVLAVDHDIEIRICNQSTFVSINSSLDLIYRSILKST